MERAKLTRHQTASVVRRTATLQMVVVAVMMGVATSVFAQAGTHDLARRLVSEGIEAAKSNDWETARNSI